MTAKQIEIEGIIYDSSRDFITKAFPDWDQVWISIQPDYDARTIINEVDNYLMLLMREQIEQIDAIS